MTAGKFSIPSYIENDAEGKEIFTQWLLKKGFTITKSEEDYDVDLIAYHEKHDMEFRFEVEVNRMKSITHEDNLVAFLARKAKMKNFFYVILHLATNQFIYVHSSEVFLPKYFQSRSVQTKYRAGFDSYYMIPILNLKVKSL